MPTSYPAAIDTFIDPVALDTMDGVVGGPALFHDIQHANINDAITAIEGVIGTLGNYNFAQNTTVDFFIQSPGPNTAPVFSEQLNSDPYPRYTIRAGGTSMYSNSSVPADFGGQSSGSIGNGGDFVWGWEPMYDTAYGHMISFPRVHMTDGTNNLHLTSPPLGGFPLNGTQNLSIQMDTTTPLVSGLAASGTLTVSSALFAGGGTGAVSGTITYTSVTTGTTGANGAQNGTLNGCSSTGLTTTTDTTQRKALMITDSYSAPIFWIANYGGAYLTDNWNFKYNINNNTQSNEYDIMIGFYNDAQRSNYPPNNQSVGSAVFHGADKNAYHFRTNDIYGNPNMQTYVHGLSGTVTYTMHPNGFWPSTDVGLGSAGNPWLDLWLVSSDSSSTPQHGTIYFGTGQDLTVSRGLDGFSDPQLQFFIKSNAGVYNTTYGFNYASFYPISTTYTHAPNLGGSTSPWNAVYANDFITIGPNIQIGQQAAYSVVTAAFTFTATPSVTWVAANSGAPSITLPNDGHTYRIMFSASYVSTNQAQTTILGLGTSTSGVFKTQQISEGAATEGGEPVNITAQSVTGSGQTVTIFGATNGASSATLTVGAGTVGNSPTTGLVGPCELAAYRVA